MKRRIITVAIAGAILISALSVTSCRSNQSYETSDLMTDIKAESHDSTNPDDSFKTAYDNFTANLLKESFDGSSDTFISPLSISTVLAMTANGANGQTKDEMEKVLGNGISLDEFNKYLSSFNDSLSSGEDFSIINANSIWFVKDNNFNVKHDFLQVNADYYHAEIFKRAYNDDIVNNINEWVSKHTDGMIDNLLDNSDT